MHRSLVLVVIAALATVVLAPATPARAAERHVKVAIIVGPVGEELTPTYIALAEAAADVAERHGARVARAYSPKATAERVLAAVRNANVVIYFGHGVGSPNPYSAAPDPATTNGWGLNGPRANGHADSWRDGSLQYYGESWIAANARPAPGWVMIYSNACYAPGAGEGFDEPAAEEVAVGRVSAYSRAPLAELGASAYFAIDFFQGAAALLAALLEEPDAAYADVFAAVPDHDPASVTRHPHAGIGGAEAWLQRSAYFDGLEDYWYAFAGDPAGTFAAGLGGAGVGRPRAADVPPLQIVDGSIRGIASHYASTAGWDGKATVALPAELGGGAPQGKPIRVVVCVDRCVALPVVDSCPCYVGTADQRVVNLSHAAWRRVTDAPLSVGLVEAEVRFEPLEPLEPPGPPPDVPPPS